MLGIWASSEDVALYAMAMRTAMLTSFVLIGVNSISAPKFAAIYSSGNNLELHRTAKIASSIIVVCAIPVILIILTFPEFIMSMFGEEFVKAAPILKVLAFGQLINIICGSCGNLLEMTGNEKYLQRNVFTSAVIMLVGGCIFIPFYGALGAAWVTSVCIALQNLLCVKDVKNVLGFNTMIFWQKA